MELSVQWDAEELGSYLLEIGVHEDVDGNIIGNRITGALFLQLSEDDLKAGELALTIGDRIALRKVLDQARKVSILCLTSTNSAIESTRFLPHMQVLPPTNSGHTEGASQCRVSTDPNSHALPESDYRSSSSSILGSTTDHRASSDWHNNFVIPDLHTFSHHVKQAISTGVVTGRAKERLPRC